MKNKQELLKDLAELTKLKENLMGACEQIYDQVDGIFFTKSEADRVVGLIKREDHQEEFIGEITTLLDEMYTEDEIRALCCFYSENPWCMEKMMKTFKASSAMGQRLIQKWMND